MTRQPHPPIRGLRYWDHHRISRTRLRTTTCKPDPSQRGSSPWLIPVTLLTNRSPTRPLRPAFGIQSVSARAPAGSLKSETNIRPSIFFLLEISGCYSNRRIVGRRGAVVQNKSLVVMYFASIHLSVPSAPTIDYPHYVRRTRRRST